MTTFFIAGMQRSGTTLLSVLLDNHPDVLMERRSMAFRIITRMNNLYDILPYNLSVDKDAFLSWLIKTDEEGRLGGLLDHKQAGQYASIRAYISASIASKLRESGKLVWGDKSPNVQYFLNDLLLLIPEAKIVHIVRDGRANAYSMTQRAHKHLLLGAQQWVDGNIKGLAHQQILGPDKYQVIKYEQLLLQPAQVLQSVCAFLGITYSEDMTNMTDDHVEEEKRYVKSTLDLSKIDQWKKQLSAKEIRQIERIQGPLLQKLGYDLMTPSDQLRHQPLSVARRIYYNQSDNVKQLFISKRMGMKDRQNVEIDITLKSRLYTFCRVLTQDLFSRPIFRSIFSRVFYKEKYYQPEEKPPTNNQDT